MTCDSPFRREEEAAAPVANAAGSSAAAAGTGSASGEGAMTAVSVGAYDGPGGGDGRFLSFGKGESFTVLNKSKQWWDVRAADGREGKVPKNFMKLNIVQPVQAPATSSASAETVPAASAETAPTAKVTKKPPDNFLDRSSLLKDDFE